MNEQRFRKDVSRILFDYGLNKLYKIVGTFFMADRFRGERGAVLQSKKTGKRFKLHHCDIKELNVQGDRKMCEIKDLEWEISETLTEITWGSNLKGYRIRLWNVPEQPYRLHYRRAKMGDYETLEAAKEAAKFDFENWVMKFLNVSED